MASKMEMRALRALCDMQEERDAARADSDRVERDLARAEKQLDARFTLEAESLDHRSVAAAAL